MIGVEPGQVDTTRLPGGAVCPSTASCAVVSSPLREGDAQHRGRRSARTERVPRIRQFVGENANEGDRQNLLRALDRFARERHFFMNVVPEKGPLVGAIS